MSGGENANQPSFPTDVQGVVSKEQNTATVAFLWCGDPKKGHGDLSEPPTFNSCVGKTQGVPFSHRLYQASKGSNGGEWRKIF
jgi:hypothetical protein